ncbi:MAG TPA: hypothetical protein VKU92_04220 [Acidimicrobiales bacterium]|nr:hypothetical protein [Acidimicrobiales bacterium]
MSKLLLDSDWLTALGGGERYLYALAEAIASAGEVTIGATELPSGERMERLGFPLRYPVVQIPRSALQKETAAYDLFVHLTLRLPMPNAAGRSIAIVQFPADSADRLRAWRHPRNRLRTGPPRRALSGYEFVVFFEFVRGWLRRRWGVDAEILRPPQTGSDSRSYCPGRSRRSFLAPGSSGTAK